MSDSLENIKCSLCEGTTKDSHVYKLYKQSEERHLCAFCLETVVANISPMVYNRVVEECTIAYHDKDKEKYFAVLARIDTMVSTATQLSSTLPVSLKEQIVTAEYSESPFIENLKVKSKKWLDSINKEEITKIPTPKEIFSKLEEVVVAQTNAKRVLAVAAYNHYKRPFLIDKGIQFGKSNILLTGPTGCGKTYLVAEMAKILDVPMIVFDANTITSAGYSGADVEDMVKALFFKADKNIEKTERGIIVIDEIDKLAEKKNSNVKGKDATSSGAQEALLKVIEGSIVNISLGPRSQKMHVQIDTTNILFVCMGAFTEIPGIVQDRSGGANTSFLGGKKYELDNLDQGYSQVTSEDFIEFGLIPELIGRLPIIVSLQELTEADLVAIISDTKNSLLAQYGAQLEFDGVTLDIPVSSQKLIAEYAIKREVGARGLRSAFDAILLDLMFNAPDEDMTTITITPEMVKEKLDANY